MNIKRIKKSLIQVILPLFIEHFVLCGKKYKFLPHRVFYDMKALFYRISICGKNF